MQKYIKFILLIIISLCLSGCGEKEYQEYLDAIGDGVTCTYYPYGENKYSDSINSVTFSATESGLDIIYKIKGASVTSSLIEVTFKNNGEFKNIKENKSHKVGNYTFDYSAFVTQNYFNIYKTSKSCPQNIYLSETYGKMQFYETKYAELVDSLTYTFTTSNTGGGSNNSCTKPDADNCKTYDKETYLDGPVTIELGRANGLEYFTISTLTNRDGDSKYSEGDSRAISVGSYAYRIMGRDWDALFIGDSSYASDIFLYEVALPGGQNAIFITVEGSETIAEFSEFSSVKDSLPPGVGYNDRLFDDDANAEQEPLPISEIKFCEENGVRMTFRVIGYALFIAKILIPLLLIILGTIDFVKATLSSSDKAPQEALGAFARRIIIAIIIFLIPTILNLVLSLVDGASEAFKDSKFTDCTNCLFSPFTKCDVKKMTSSQ